MTELPLGTGEADLVACFSGLHMLDDPREALSEFARCLRPGGELTGTTFLDDLAGGPGACSGSDTAVGTRCLRGATSCSRTCGRPASAKPRSDLSRASPLSALAAAPRCSRGRLAAVDMEDLAGHERRPLQVEHPVDHVADRAQASERVELASPVEEAGSWIGLG